MANCLSYWWTIPRYLHRDRPTNVIAFAMREGPFGDINPKMLGDVIISLETAANEARQAGLSLTTRFHQLLVHGILHVFGYDHENCEKEAAIMEAKCMYSVTITKIPKKRRPLWRPRARRF